MQRYFISEKQINNDYIKIVGEDVHHLKNVLRVSCGDSILCCNGQGMDYLTQIRMVSSQEVECEIIERTSSRGEPKVRITIAQSLPKREKFEWVLQKGTEIGAIRFIPFYSERTTVKFDKKKVDQKLYRWRKIVKEAAEQAHRGVIPEVATPTSWIELLHLIPQKEVAFLAYENGGKKLSRQLGATSYKDILIVIGPEGGFTQTEVTKAQECGATLISLGPRILRTETAPLVLLSNILYQSGDI